MEFPVRRLLAAAIVTALLVAGSAARADTMQDLAAIAGKKGPVIWYESSPPEAVLKIAAAFNKKYPDIKIQFASPSASNVTYARAVAAARAGSNALGLARSAWTTPAKPCPAPRWRLREP